MASSFHLYCHMPSGQSRVYQVTQLRTDGVHCLESTGTVPVVLKVVRVTGAAFLGIPTNQIMCASVFQHLLLVCSGHVESIGVATVGHNRPDARASASHREELVA